MGEFELQMPHKRNSLSGDDYRKDYPTMSLFTVDETKCKHDGICADICPRGLIEMKDDDSLPVPTSVAEEMCSRCGHCVAVCPHGALSHTAMTPEQCPPVRREWLLDQERVEHFLRSRRSIRNYKNKKVDRDLLTKLIDIARFGPTGGKSQPVQWRVIYDTEEVQRLSEMIFAWLSQCMNDPEQENLIKKFSHTVAAWERGEDRISRGAPHLIVTHAPKDSPGALSACTIALTYLELASPSLGLGACWSGFLHEASKVWAPLQKALSLPEEHECFGAMMIGYPKYAYQRLPLRDEPMISWQ
jgi:nitroreductase/ferredoxin